MKQAPSSIETSKTSVRILVSILNGGLYFPAGRTKEQRQGFVRPPCEEHEEGRPEEQELDAEVDCPGFGECCWRFRCPKEIA